MVPEAQYLEMLHKRLLWLACWTVHNANHLRDKAEGDVKVGGHQASSASMAAIVNRQRKLTSVELQASD